MKRKNYFAFMILMIVLWLMPITIFGQFTVDATWRPRPEYRSGYREIATNDTKPVFLISQRTRLGLTYQSKKISGKISFQDVRVWGDETKYSSTGVFGDDASIDLAEAWVSFRFMSDWMIKVGRQSLSLDDHRLLSKRNWNQNGLFYDAITVQYHSEKMDVNAGFFYNNTYDRNFQEPYNPALLKSMVFGHVSKSIGEYWDVAFISLCSGVTASDTSLAVYGKGSSGINLNFNKSNWKLFSSFYYQYGKDTYMGFVKNVSAYNLNLSIQYKVSRFSLEGGCSLLSGDDEWNASSGTTHMFDLLYGARHKYYGLMDYFSNLRKSTAHGGLNDFYTTLGVTIMPKVQVFGAGHLFYLNQVPLSLAEGPSGNSSSYLASEIDVWVNADFWEMVNLQTGYSFILPGSQLETIQKVNGNASFSSWAWIMVTVSVKSGKF